MALKASRSFMTWPLPTSNFFICHSPSFTIPSHTGHSILMLQLAKPVLAPRVLHWLLFLPGMLFSLSKASSFKTFRFQFKHHLLRQACSLIIFHIPLAQAKLLSLTCISNYHSLKYLFTCPSPPHPWPPECLKWCLAQSTNSC